MAELLARGVTKDVAVMEQVEMVTWDEAEEIHALARGTDPNHDRSDCWCCCMDCDELHERLIDVPNQD